MLLFMGYVFRRELASPIHRGRRLSEETIAVRKWEESPSGKLKLEPYSYAELFRSNSDTNCREPKTLHLHGNGPAR